MRGLACFCLYVIAGLSSGVSSFLHMMARPFLIVAMWSFDKAREFQSPPPASKEH